MAASTQDMMNQFQAQLALGPQQSLFGVSAPPDPSKIAALLGQLKQQQYQEQANRPTPGPYGYLHDAGNLQANAVGQTLGQGLGGALNIIGQQGQPAQAPQAPFSAPPPAADGSSAIIAPTPTPGATAQQTVNNQIQAAKAYNQALIKSGVPADEAKVQTLQKLVDWGNPQAAEQLVSAQQDVLKNNFTKSEAAKDTSQSNMDNSDITKNAVETSAKQWKTTYTDPNGLFMLQTNGAGQVQRVELKPPPSASTQAAAGLTPNALQTMVDTRLTTGKDPVGATRGGFAVPYYNALADRLQQTGDTVGAANARAQGYKAAGTSYTQNQKLITNTTNAGAQIEKNIASLQPVVQRMGGIGSPVFQRALNQWNQGIAGDKDTAQAVFYINELQSELGRVSSNTFGNTPLSDSAKADAKELINKSMIGTGSLDGVMIASRQSYQNKLNSLNDTQNGLKGQLGQNAPGSPFGTPPGGQTTPTPPPAVTPPPKPVPTYNPKTGKFE